jgi:hypothetical protein
MTIEDGVVTDLNGCAKLLSAPYVILSRIRQQNQLFLIREFPLSLLQHSMVYALRQEMIRLEQLDLKSACEFEDIVPGLVDTTLQYIRRQRGLRLEADRLAENKQNKQTKNKKTRKTRKQTEQPTDFDDDAAAASSPFCNWHIMPFRARVGKQAISNWISPADMRAYCNSQRSTWIVDQ